MAMSFGRMQQLSDEYASATVTSPAMNSPRFDEVPCLSPAGFHTMRWTEWGDPANPRVLICVHGLTRVGRDFDLLAQRLAAHYRVVCPDVMGRGRSDWLRDPAHYHVAQYASDMAALIARLNAATLHWVGTSMGGLIGMTLAGQPGSPIAKIVINDVGPTLDAAALARIGDYLGKPVRFADVEQATDYVAAISAPFGLKTRDEWRAITETVIRRDGDAWIPHYDPRIALPFKSVTRESAAAGEAALWKLYDSIACPTLLTRGKNSDLLSANTARAMTERGPRAQLVEFEGIGHAPMFMHDDQIEAVAQFLLED
jgi:pimeloyl-ACP methyl ester carboxylesterase